MTFNPDIVAAIIAYVAGVLSLALSFTGIVPTNLIPWVNLAIGSLQLALGTFFFAKKPVAAVRAWAASKAATKPK